MNQVNQEEVDRWVRKKEEAFKALGRVKGEKGQPFENDYNLAYRKLVSLGVRPKLKGKYGVR